MRKLKVLFIAVILGTSSFFNANAQINARSSNSTDAQNSSAQTQSKNNVEVTALIPVADTSPSVKKQLGEIKQRAKELIAIAPAGTRIGVVGINWEATKKLFNNSAEAEKLIDSLTVGGNYTDLARGNDAALSLVQEAGASRAAIVFLTDGKATVPTTFKNRETFIQMLRREYAARPNIRVFVVNVKGEPLPADANLPPNVTFVAAKDWASAREVIAKELAPQIITQLAPGKKIETPNSSSNQATPDVTKKDEQSGFAGLFTVLVGLSAVAIITLPVYFWFARRNRRHYAVMTEIEEPENVLRDEEIPSAEQSSIVTPEPVLILQAERQVASQLVSGRNAATFRAFVRAGERLIIGNSHFSAGLELPGLKQAQTLEVAFDGTQATFFRLRPSANELLDTITLGDDGANATARFVLRSDQKLYVGEFEIELTLGDESAVNLLATAPRTNAAIITAPAEASEKLQLRGGRFRRNGSG